MIPKKYTKGLTKKQAEKKAQNIKQTKELLKKGKKREAFKKASKRPTTKKGKKSSFTIRFRKDFPKVKPLTKGFTSATGIPLKAQREIFKRGKGAFASAGSRASVSSPEQWAYARLYAFYYKLKKDKLDFDKDLVSKYKIKTK